MMPASTQKFQDAYLLITVFEEKAILDTSEESAFVPLGRVVATTQDEMIAMQQAFIPHEIMAREFSTPGDTDKAFDKIQEKAAAGDETLTHGVVDSMKESQDAIADVLSFGATRLDDLARTSKEAESFVRWLTDCIPCTDRLKQFGLQSAYSLPFELFNALMDDLKRRMAFLWEIFDVLTSTEVYGDICWLLQFLRFQCVPDLAGLLTVLIFLMQKYSIDFKQAQFLPGYWIASMFYIPFALAGLATLGRYIGQVKGIIKCISDSLIDVINKLDVEKPFARAGEKTTGQTATAEIDKFSKQGVRGLQMLYDTIAKGFEAIDNQLEKIGKAIGSVMGADKLIDYAKTKMQLARFVSLIRFCIETTVSIMTEKHQFKVSEGTERGWDVECTGPDPEFQKLINEFADWMQRQMNNEVEVTYNEDDGYTSIKWKIFPDLEVLGGSEGEWFRKEKQQQDEAIKKSGLTGDDSDESRDTINRQITLDRAMNGVEIHCPNLTNLFRGKDSSTIQEWARELATS